MYVCAYVSHMCMMCVRGQRATASGVVPQAQSTLLYFLLVFETGSLSILKLTNWARPAGHQAPGIHLPLPPQR